jgi:gas vesicle protein
MSNKSQIGAFISGAIIGGTIGAVLGLSVAPRTGKETRKVLKKSVEALPELTEDLASTVQMQASRLSASTLRNWDDTLIRLRTAIAAGIEASQLAQKSEKPLISSKDLNSTTLDRN